MDKDFIVDNWDLNVVTQQLIFRMLIDAIISQWACSDFLLVLPGLTFSFTSKLQNLELGSKIKNK